MTCRYKVVIGCQNCQGKSRRTAIVYVGGFDFRLLRGSVLMVARRSLQILDYESGNFEKEVKNGAGRMTAGGRCGMSKM